MFAAYVVLWLGLLIALPDRPSTWLVIASGLPLLAWASWRSARRAGRTWRDHIEETADQHGLAVVLLYALGVLMQDTHGITTDGVTYFAQLRSLVFDRDLDVSREFEILGQPPRSPHMVPLGPTVLWSPWYLAVTAVDAVGRGLGWWRSDPSTLGLTLPYIRAALLASFALAAAGLWLLLEHLRTRFAHAVAWATMVLVLGATPLFWYMVYEPSMTHAAAFGFTAIFAVLSARWVPRGATATQSLLLGTVLGLAFAVRSQESLFALLPALLVFGTRDAWAVRARQATRLAGWGLVGAAPWIVLQAVHSYVLYTRSGHNLVGDGGYLNIWQSRWLDTLFSSWHGFFSWTPVAYVAALGTVAYLRRDWRWATAGLFILFLTAWINGATQDWAGGWSFGGRRFTTTLVLLAPGLALAIEAVVRRPLVAVAPLVVAALWWNHLLMVQYTRTQLPKDEPVSFGRLVRQQATVHTAPPYFYPFAFPANVWFAWREGLPIDRYDELGPVPTAPSFRTDFGRSVEKFLLEGWDAPGGDDWGSVWWIGGSPATLAVPVQLPAGAAVLTVRSRTRLDEPAVRVELAVDVNGVEVGRVMGGVPDPSDTAISVPAAVVARAFRHGFNRVAFRTVAVQRVDPADTRPAGPLAVAATKNRGVFPVAIYSLAIEPAR